MNTVVMLGAGNMAWQLGKVIQKSKYEILQIYSRTDISAKALAKQLQVPYTTDIEQIRLDADLYIIAVRDDAIAEVAASLPCTNQTVVHTAGSVPLTVLSERFSSCGVIYPLQSFSKVQKVDFSEIPIFVEANDGFLQRKLRKFSKRFSRHVYPLSSEARLQLHLAAVICSNFANCLYGITADLLREVNLPFDLMAPLLRETVRKAVVSNNPQKEQTGPASRKDRLTMDKHLAMLANNPSRQSIYEVMSLEIARQQGIDINYDYDK